MSTSHEPAYSEDGLPKDRYRLYHLERAKGGIALTMTAGSAIVSRDSPAPFGNLQLYRDEIVPWLKHLADDCHNEGCAVMIQVTHMGRRTGWNKADWLPVLGPSMVREAAHRAFPKVAEDWDLERIKNDFADAAERVKAAGLDGFELQCYGQLLEQFWSPGMNKRQDEHGGSLDNRLRFTFDVLKAIRKRIGPEFIIGLRLVTDEQWELGISKDEGLEIARRFKDSGLIDFLNVIRGRIDNDAVLSRIIPVTGMPSAPHLDYAGEIRAATKFPVFHAARIPDVATARHAIASGKLDMVGMTRALLTDPHIVRKIETGIEDQIRPCVGATYCLDRIYEGGEALCIHNPASGREASMPHVIRRSRDPGLKVVVVGAGPAGLEAARVSGERGHRVVLFEASKEAGGQLRLAATGTRRRELIGIAEWRLAQLDRLGVDLRFNRWAEAEDVLAEKPDIVVVATGGLANQDCIDFGRELTVSSWDILTGDAKAGEEVLLFDDNGAHPGMQAAEKIALGGAKLEIVTPERNFAPEIGGLNHVPYQEVFQPRGVRLTTMRRLKGVKRSGNKLLATIGSDFGPWTEERLVDQVVVEHGTLPLADLYFSLRPLSINDGEVDYDALIAGQPQNLNRRPEAAFRLYRIGDAVASRNIHAAIYDALRLAKDF